MAEPVIKSAASADALKESGQTENSTNAKPIEQNGPPPKKPRFNREQGKRHGGTSYTKSTPITSLMITPRRRVFPVYTSNIGCDILSRIGFNAIRGRDHRLAQSITQSQLAYVMVIAYCNRIVQCAINYGYAFPLGASRLKQVATGIQLPTVLAQYIESIGSLELATGATIVPYCSEYQQLFQLPHELMLDPARLLEIEQREVPPGEWAIDVDWIVEYNDATTRASRSGMKFRVVDNSDLRGRAEMTVSYIQTPDNMLLPKAPQIMTEAEAQLGATYHFRDYALLEQWIGENKAMLFDAFTAIPLDPQVVFSDICVAAFRGAQVTTE